MYLFAKGEKQYRPLAQQQPVAGEPPSLASNDVLHSPSQCRNSRLTVYLIIEALIMTCLFVLYEHGIAATDAKSKSNFSERYLKLQDYNQTVIFTENVEMMRKSANSSKFWSDLQYTSGIVSVPTEWALSLGFAPTLESPETPGHSIYQLDMYHSLHCLYHIRNRLVSKLPLEAWPRDDVHSLHCINFLRQQVLCHGDTTLQGTDDFLHFAKNPGHKCRDTKAIRTWVQERNWAGHAKWIKDVYGLS